MADSYGDALTSNLLAVMPSLSIPYLVGSLIFSLIGSLGYYYYRKSAHRIRRYASLVLMVLIPMIPDSVLMYLLGICTTLVLLFWKEQV